jgi:hypothetical protein
MTRDAIAEELIPLLNQEPKAKGDVVHVLIQIRNMLEYDKKPDRFWELDFFCNWVAHPQLAGTGARRVLKLLDERLPTFDFRNPEGVDPDGMVSKILSFDLLRQSLFEFLWENRLPTRWAEDDFTWKTVVQLYGQQVRNTPLVVENDKNMFKFIRRVEIVACEPSRKIMEANPAQKYYGFKWYVSLNDGRSFSWPYTSNVPDKPKNWPTQGIRISR